MFNCGRLKKHIEILRWITTQNELGSTVTKLEKVKNVYGEIRPMRGREYEELGNKELHDFITRITIRYWNGLLPTDVFRYQDQQYEIQSIINPEMTNQILECLCISIAEKRRNEADYGEEQIRI